jgi:cob(I)alamin adenosyltransferase
MSAHKHQNIKDVLFKKIQDVFEREEIISFNEKSKTIVSRLLTTLSPLLPDIEDLHTAANTAKTRFYTDPATGYKVIPKWVHEKRGTCCGNKCRHCPYAWVNVFQYSKDVTPDKRLEDWGGRVGGEDGEKVDTCPLKFGDGKTSMDITQMVRERLEIRQVEESLPPAPPTRTTCTEDVDSPLNVPYTRTGDFGETSLPLLSGLARASKASDSVELMGAVDELCACAGYLHELIGEEDGDSALLLQIEFIVDRLFDIGAIVAQGSHIAAPSPTPPSLITLPVAAVATLETDIDAMTALLPPLTNFVQPIHNGKVSSYAHVCRTVCRRAEREYVRAMKGVEIDGGQVEVGVFLNRLSDWFFQASRIVGKGKDVKFKKSVETGRREKVIE